MNARINKTLLPIARELITRGFGNLDDLPPELQNTIANIYYNSARLLGAAQNNPGWVPTKDGQLADMKTFGKELSFLSAAVESLPQFVAELRNLRGKNPAWLYDYSATYGLDLFKYRLPQWTMKLPPILRAPLRLFSDAPSKEIPNLYKLLRRDRGSSDPRHEKNQESVDGLSEQLSEALAHNATIYPPSESFTGLLSQSGYRGISEDRLRFGLSIANEVLNIWLINDCIPLPHRAKQTIDLVHRAFFKNQGKKEIRIGDFIVTAAELSQIAREIGGVSNDRVSNVQAIRTNWWSLMDMIYLSRQQTYYDALQNAADSKLSHEFGPTTFVAFELAKHLTGADMKSGGDSFQKLTAGLASFLAIYAQSTREMLAKLR